jgi:hypothetical protein
VRLPAGGLAQPAPAPHTPIEDQGGNFGPLRLRGYDWQAETSHLRLTWQAVQPPGQDYAVGVHIIDEVGALVAQADAEPNLPMRYWRVGQSYISTHKLPLESLPQGQYSVWVMVYDRQSGARLDNGTDARTLALFSLER